MVEGMKRYEIAVYVAPEHVEKFDQVIEADGDNCFLLDIERLAGVHLDNMDNTVAMGQFRHTAQHSGDCYGADVVEVSAEGVN